MNTEDHHIVTAFDEDLGEIDDLVMRMGGMAEVQLNEAVSALIKRDGDAAAQIVAGDRRIDALETELNQLSVRFIARRQPMAEDLRVVVAALKIAGNLERIGDYAKNIAKRTSTLTDTTLTASSANMIQRMTRIVQEMIHDVLEAYTRRDVMAADDVRARDEDVDQMHNTLFREQLTYMMEDARNITASMHLLFIAKNLERIGDHTTSIAEQVHFLISGELPQDDRPKNDKTSYTSMEPPPGRAP